MAALSKLTKAQREARIKRLELMYTRLLNRTSTPLAIARVDTHKSQYGTHR